MNVSKTLQGVWGRVPGPRFNCPARAGDLSRMRLARCAPLNAASVERRGLNDDSALRVVLKKFPTTTGATQIAPT
jgi:hypothetical protein